MEQKQEKLSILMLPFLAHGHTYPFLELAKKLSARNFKIYICSSPANLAESVDREAAEASSMELVELAVPSSPELPPHMHTTKNLPPHLMPNLLDAFQSSGDGFLQVLAAKKPDLVIYDFTPAWVPKLASSKGIPAVFFGTVGSTQFAYHYHHRPSAEENGRSPFPSEAIYLLDHEKFNAADRESMWDLYFGNLGRSAEIALMKSCRAVEEKYCDYLSTLCDKEVLTTGPLVCSDGGSESGGGGGVLKWLSGKDRCSTLYISFGSQHFLSAKEIQEIAKGLELCPKVNFIWVIRLSPQDSPTTSLDQVLPQTFLHKTKERGMIITGWAPQQKILAHPSTGGFLSHCGTNAIGEAMVFGVPVIAMPMKYDQPINARILVEAGFAIEVAGKPAGTEWVFNCYVGEDIAKGISKVFEEKEFGEGLRKRGMEIAQKIKETEEDEIEYAAEQLLKLGVRYKQGRLSLAL